MTDLPKQEHTLKIAGTIEEFVQSFVNEAGRTVAQNSFMRSVLTNGPATSMPGRLSQSVELSKRVTFDRTDVATVVDAFTELTSYLLVTEEDALFSAALNQLDLDGFGPRNVEQLRQVIVSQNTPVTCCAIPSPVWIDWLADKQIQALLEPHTDEGVVTSGRLANLLGIEILSDVFRHPKARIIRPDDVFMFGADAGYYDFSQPDIKYGDNYLEFNCWLYTSVNTDRMVRGVLPCR